MTETTITASRQLPPGRAGDYLRGLAQKPGIHDLYDAVGAPVYHDLAAGDTSEIRELLGIVRRTPGPILELAAGSGRLTLPLLALGRDVTALELSADMLALLERELAALPARRRALCVPVRGDMTAFTLNCTFPVIVLGTTSVSLLDEGGRAGLFRAVRTHLAPGGVLVMSNVNISSADTTGSDQEYELAGVSGRRYRAFEHWPTGSLTRNVTIVAAPDSARPGPVCTTTIGVLPLDLLERELTDAGLAVRARTPLPPTGLHYNDVLLEVEAIR